MFIGPYFGDELDRLEVILTVNGKLFCFSMHWALIMIGASFTANMSSYFIALVIDLVMN